MVLLFALAVLWAAIFSGSHRLCTSLSHQLVDRDGEILHAVALAGQFSPGGATNNLADRLQNPADQLALVLNISQIVDGVLAVRLFDARGNSVTAFPPDVATIQLSAETVSQLQALKPVSQFQPDGSLADIFIPGTASATTTPTPLVTVNLPLHDRSQPELIASAQIILDASNLARELTQLSNHLRRQAWLAFFAGGSLVTVVFVWAYRRLQASHQQLAERTARLLRANHELSLAAKTGALGAVAAHLVHGLSNPLANLQAFIAAHQGKDDPAGEWKEVVASTQHMQAIVLEVVRVMGEEKSLDNYDITFAELAGILAEKLRAFAGATGVKFAVHLRTDGVLSNRHANLVLLILENLVRNALEVTPRGKPVELTFFAAAGDLICEVADAGPGLALELRGRIFMPCRSTKGGNGLGLAISHRLAAQMEAKLELAKTDGNGCIFRLTVPAAVLAPDRVVSEI